MRKYKLILILMIFFACGKQKNNETVIWKKEKELKNISKKEYKYSFDSLSIINGCANILLQKISKDLQYELKIDIEFDKIPYLKEIDIVKYSEFIKIYLNKYPKENKYIKGVCDDKIYGVSKVGNKYVALTGNLNITYYDKRYISVLVKNLILQDSNKQTIFLTKEKFEKVMINWKGG